MRMIAGCVFAWLCVASALAQVIVDEKGLPLNVTDVPKLADIKIDGDAADWGDRGMRYDVLTEAVPGPRPYGDHDATVRLAWNDDGLLVLVNVFDTSAVESDRDNALWEGDSVEFFLAGMEDKSGFIQFAVAPGIDPAHPKLRRVIVDNRPVSTRGMFDDVFRAKKTGTGYCVEAMLPWAIFNPPVAKGQLRRLQIHINDRDAGRQSVQQLLLYPERFARKLQNMVTVQAADVESVPVRSAASAAVERFRRIRVNAATTYPSKSFRVWCPNAAMSEMVYDFQSNGRMQVASVTLPLQPYQDVQMVQVSLSDLPIRSITISDVEKARERAIAELPIVASPSVFDRPTFPPIDFRSPAEAEDLIGLYTLTVKYYDADFNEVTAPKSPGRYGAIVSLPGGRPFNRFVTLYRTPGKLRWRGEGIEADLKLPPSYGVDAAVLRERAAELGDFLSGSRGAFSGRGGDLDVLLAGLSELKAGVAPPVQRTGPWARNAAWWHELQKRTGTLTPYKYIASVPKQYDQQPDTRWPLILFLHGSGERGTDLKAVTVHGPSQYFKDHDQPFVLVSPQCPFGQGWDVPRLNDLLDQIAAKYRIDPDRIYLTGLSMGGFGSWDLAMASPERFAAVVPICGGGDPADAARIKNLPTWIFHGGRDETVDPDESYRMVSALRQQHGRVRFTLYPEADHNSWTATYNNPALYEWLLKQKRGQPDQQPATMPGTQPSE